MEASKLSKYVIVTIVALAVLVLTFFWSKSLLLTALIASGLFLAAYVIYILNRKANILILFFDDLTRSIDRFELWLKTISDRSGIIHEDLQKNLAETMGGLEKTEKTLKHGKELLQEAKHIKDVMQQEKVAIEAIREEIKKLLIESTQIQNHIQQEKVATENIRQKSERLIEETKSITEKTEQLLEEIETIKEKSEQLKKGIEGNQEQALKGIRTTEQTLQHGKELLQKASEKIMQDSGQIINEIKQAHQNITHLENTSVKKIDECFFQIEALFSIFFSIKPDFPIQSTTGWAASAGLIKKVMEIMFEKKPVRTLEVGSGLSTLIIGHCLKKLGQGKLIAIEHEQKYLEQSQSMINVHGLNDFVSIVYAPIKEYAIGGKKWLWYEDTVLKSLPEKSIDFLLIDGPPESLQPLSRYPAIPLLNKYIRKDAVAILDDANRPGEKEIMEKWKNDYRALRYHKGDTEKGAFIITNFV